MKEFNFKDRTVEFKICEKVYKINVSNFEFIKKCQENLELLEMEQKEYNESKNADGLLAALKSLIDLVLENDFDKLWEEAGHDFYSMLDLAVELAEIVRKGFVYKNDKYLQSTNR